MKKNFIVVLGLICTALLIGLFVRRQDEDAGERCDNAGGKRKIAASLPVNSGEERENRPVKSNVGGPARGGQNESVGDTRRDAAEEAESDDDAVERSIEQFDELTDKWSEPGNGISVTMDDVVDFSAKFRKIPKSRKEECLQRALNLIPDENIMLLAGILMDKTYDKELIELVYNDVLNRDEEAKMSILRQIYKDRTHPCWPDTAWIFDVSGQLPDAK